MRSIALCSILSLAGVLAFSPELSAQTGTLRPSDTQPLKEVTPGPGWLTVAHDLDGWQETTRRSAATALVGIFRRADGKAIAKIQLSPGTELWEYLCVPSESQEYNDRLTKPGTGAT